MSGMASDGSSQESHHYDDEKALDRQMLQHLLRRYGQTGLNQLIQDVSGPQGDAASIISSAAQSSVISDDASSIWDTQSVRTFSSDTSSIAGSILSNVSRGAKFLVRRSSSNNHHSSGSTVISSPAATPTHAPAATGKGASLTSQALASATHRSKVEDALSLSGDLSRGEAAAGSLVTESQTQTPKATDSSASATAAGSSSASKQKGTFMCGLCKEGGIVKTCTRKNDLKRHMEDFHNDNAQWFCRQSGCQLVFDWQAAYKTHLKTAHGGSRMALDEVKVSLCPQVVFACGFERCNQVYEARGDDDAGSVFKEYVGHVVKHFDEGSNNTGEWTYSARIRNLMGQRQVAAAWNESSAFNQGRDDLRWSPQTSGILRKRLESRHIGDIRVLIQNAYLLGSDPSHHPQQFRGDFITPFADTCMLAIPGHKSRRQQSMAGPDPAENMTFHISRGANPALAQYMDSQRKIYVNHRQSVRGPGQLHRPTSNPAAAAAGALGGQHQHQHQLSRSSHAVHHQQQQHNANHRSTLGHFFAEAPGMPSSPAYHDPRANGRGPGSQAHFAVANNGAMHQNGIVADDLQSLRSMTGTTPEPSDVEMHDSAGLVVGFSPHYPGHGLQSPAPSMDGHQVMAEHPGYY